jgi:hypothetical protein
MPGRRQPASPSRDRVAQEVGAAKVNYNWTQHTQHLMAVQDLERKDVDVKKMSSPSGGNGKFTKGTVTVRPFSAYAPAAVSGMPAEGASSPVGSPRAPPPPRPRLSRVPGLRDEKWVRKLKLKLKLNPAADAPPAEDDDNDDNAEDAASVSRIRVGFKGAAGAALAGVRMDKASGRERPCSLDDVKRIMTDEPDKSASFRMAINSPRSVVMCLLTVGGLAVQAECSVTHSLVSTPAPCPCPLTLPLDPAP